MHRSQYPRPSLHISTHFEDLRISFPGSPALESKPSPPFRAKLPYDLTSHFKDQNQINTNLTFETLKLDSIIAGLERDLEVSGNPKLDLSPTKTKSNVSSPKRRGRNTPVYFNNYDYYEQRITQKEKESFSITHQPESNNFSSCILVNEEQNRTEIHHSILDFDLQEAINEAEAYSTIQLPDQEIKVGKLLISKPLTIRGSSSCVIEVTDSINVNLMGYSNTEEHVVISECTIKFECPNKDLLNQSISSKRSKVGSEIKLPTEKKSYSEFLNQNQSYYATGFATTGHATTDVRKTDRFSQNEGRIYPLFIIHSNSVLEVRDSNISSKKGTSILTTSFQEVCFYLEHHSKAHSLTMKESDLSPSVLVQSTCINNFYTTIQNNLLGKIYLEKLYITNTQGHAMNISNPHLFEMKECVLEETGKSCLNVRFSAEFTADLKRKVVIENNKFEKGTGYGISIFGENMKAHTCVIDIKDNQLNGFEKDGIGIKNLNTSQINIERNTVTKCVRNGICLQNILDTATFNQVKLAENKISHSKLYGLVLMDVSCYSEKDEIYQNSKAGVYLSGVAKTITKEENNFYKKYPLRIIFNSDKIYKNKEAGFIMVGFLKGPVILNSCGLYENTNGVYINQPSQESSPSRMNRSAPTIDSSGDSINLSSLTFDKCAIFQNELTGMHLKGLANKAYLKETLIYENRNYAIFIQNEADKHNLMFKDGSKNRIQESISGFVGGPWGVLFEQNVTVCKRANCNMF